MALIFILSTLPTWISCVVLGCYILLGSFKSLASKAVAKWLLDFDKSVHYSLDAGVSLKNKYYRSELIGQFVQLFSINSFFLLFFHYTLPDVWRYYLAILAKAIVASRLVGTYTTGSTTYVSVISNSSTSTSTTSTTTVNFTSASSNLSLKSERKYPTNSFLNSLVSCISVVAIDFGICELIASWNSVSFGESTALIFSDFLSGNLALNTIFVTLVRGFFPRPSARDALFDTLNNNATGLTTHNTTSLAGQVVTHLLSNLFRLSEASTEKVNCFFAEASKIVYYAYLVLCIHVIILAIAPFLSKIFILKDYLRTLDQLSALTPDIPYDGLRNSGVPGVTRDAASNAVVVVNVELNQQSSHSSSTSLKEIKIQPAEFRDFDCINDSDIAYNVSADNFKNFCLVPPTNKTSSVGTRKNHCITIVDRKKTTSSSIPSTTIMDKYFTISIQPLWSWLAALKIIALEPLLFAEARRDLKVKNWLALSLKSCVAFIEKSRVIFELFGNLPLISDEIMVEVNGVKWDFVEVFNAPRSNQATSSTYISVFCLSPSNQYDITIFSAGQPAANHIVRTSSEVDSALLTEYIYLSKIDTLRSSLLYTALNLNNMKLDVKKAKKDENKRMQDLRRQLEALKAKFDKYVSTDSNDFRFSSKLKGLQNSVTQLKAEIKELETQIESMESPDARVDEEFAVEEKRLMTQIKDLDEHVHRYEERTNKLKQDAKLIEDDKVSTQLKLKRLEAKLLAKKEETQRIYSDIKLLMKALVLKVQKKQKNVHERYELIIPRILEAANELTEQKTRLQ